MVKPIGPTLKANLLSLANAYCEATGISLLSVSRYATNDRRTLTRLAADDAASITVRKYDDAIAWLVSNWPKGVKRPKITNPSHWRRAA